MITENSDEGTDQVFSKAATYTLSANIENLSLLGTDDIDGTGNDLNNFIEGNSGANELLAGLAVMIRSVLLMTMTPSTEVKGRMLYRLLMVA